MSILQELIFSDIMEYVYQKSKYVNIILLFGISSCCYLPLVDCFNIPEYRPRIIIDSSYIDYHEQINSYDILSKFSKKNRNTLSIIFISSNTTKIFSSTDRNYYFLNNEKRYSDKVVQLNAKNGITSGEVQIEFDLTVE